VRRISRNPAVGGRLPRPLWGNINRAMPFLELQALSADDVWALTAYILLHNDVLAGDFVTDRDKVA
jgi:hypothetical protein